MISSHLLSEIDQMVTAVGIINQGKLIFQDKVIVLNKRRQPKLLLRTGNDAGAAGILKDACPEHTEDGLLLPALDNETVGRTVQMLCDSHIPVYRVEERQRSLEDVFLELTGKAVTL